MLGTYGDIMCNYNVYAFDFPVTSYYCNADFTLNNSILYQDNFASGGGNNGGNNGGNEEPEEPEEDENIVSQFMTALLDLLIHAIIPNQDQYNDIIDRFEDQVISRFLIVPLTRSESYDNSTIYSSIGNHKPIINIWGYDFDFNDLYVALNTPINLGIVYEDFGSDPGTQWYHTINNQGVTPYSIITLVLYINLIAMNIVLYNKFMEKE